MHCVRASMLLLSAAVAMAEVDPQYAKNISVYHLNPKSAGAIPVNMDTGDAGGDLYFYLGQFLLPLECADPSANKPNNNSGGFNPAQFDCNNPERSGNLVVTKVVAEVDSRFAGYLPCNLCNGTDPFSGKPCNEGEYLCDCTNWTGGTCDRTKVGEESIDGHFTPSMPPTGQCGAALNLTCHASSFDSHECGSCIQHNSRYLWEHGCRQNDFEHYCYSQYNLRQCNETTPSWPCWRMNIPRKTHGYWYSTLKEGECNGTGQCSWRAVNVTTVHEPCLKDKLMTTAEKSAPACFEGCGPRNTTSPCWIGCFMDSLLGADARHSFTKPLGGLPLDELISKGWDAAFLPESEGGCPRVLDQPLRWQV